MLSEVCVCIGMSEKIIPFDVSEDSFYKPSGLAQMATKGNLGEVVTTCERSWVQASPWRFSFRSERSGVYLLRRMFESCIVPNWMSLGRSGTFFGQGSAVIVSANTDYLPWASTDPLLCFCHHFFFTFDLSRWSFLLTFPHRLLLQSFLGYQKCHIPDTVHPELRGLNQSIHDSPADVLEYFHINVSQLSVIVAAKESHFEILCRVHGFVPTVGLFHRFYVDALVFSLFVPWHTKKTLMRDPHPSAIEFSVEVCDFLVGISRYYDLDENVYPTFLTTDGEGGGRVVSLAVGDDQVGPSVPVVHGDHDDDGHNHEGVNIVADDEIQAIVADKPKGTRRKRKASDGSSGSNLPPKKLRDDHGSFVDANASTARKSLVVFQGLLECSSLAVEMVLWQRQLSFVPPHMVMTAVVATTAIAGTSSALVLGAGTGPAIQILFTDSASHSAGEPDTASPSNPRSAEISSDNFYVCRSMIGQLSPPGFFSQLRGMDYDQLFPEFNVGATRQTCLSSEVRLRSEHNYKERKKFERKCDRQADLLKEKDTEVASLKAQLSLKEAEAAEAICLRSQVFVIEVVEAARISELNSLKEWNLALEGDESTLEGQVTTLESAAASKDTELASDEWVGILSDHVEELDSKLMGMAIHLDEEFYHRFLTTIVGRRWILSRGIRLAVMKCLQSPEYVDALGEAIGRAIEKGMQTGLVAGLPTADAVTTALSTTFAHTSSVQSISVIDYGVLDAEPHPEASHSPKIIFEQETLETLPEYPATS
nr:hypothetical protein [Tanacetum cinerariifolium]